MEEQVTVQDGFWHINHNLVNYTGTEEQVVIPKGTVEIWDPFSTINQPSAYGKTEPGTITSIIIPASVTTITAMTFCRLYNLEEIQVDQDNKFFSSRDGVLFNKKKTELIAFPQKSKHIQYIVPETVKKIAGKAFYHNKQVQEIVLPEGLKRINPETFYGCLQLSRINIPDQVASIGKYAFYHCNSLKEVVLSSTITQIGYSAFAKLFIGKDEIGVYAVTNVNGFTVKCQTGSFAEQYAKEQKMKIEYITDFL